MKKFLLTPFFIFIIVTFSSAQRLNFGVRAGLNFSNETLTNLPHPYPSDRTSFLIGVYANYSINRKISIQSELLYSSLGAKFDPPMTEKFNYLSLPIFINYNATRNL